MGRHVSSQNCYLTPSFEMRLMELIENKEISLPVCVNLLPLNGYTKIRPKPKGTVYEAIIIAKNKQLG